MMKIELFEHWIFYCWNDKLLLSSVIASQVTSHQLLIEFK